MPAMELSNQIESLNDPFADGGDDAILLRRYRDSGNAEAMEACFNAMPPSHISSRYGRLETPGRPSRAGQCNAGAARKTLTWDFQNIAVISDSWQHFPYFRHE